ncbi:hypothetical protein HRR78_008166 [Exophiala dermatitidis]|nr:hypothetical protein HRR75_008232 [Exophiala dermatitidis]KAJ4538634.1 hypothetical protein HRR78_008166 [Exophiala dermatitidis]
MSQPTESDILYSYLLQPSSLSTIIPYTKFQSLSPHKSPTITPSSGPNLIKRLYRDLEFQRSITIDHVRRRIDEECRRSGQPYSLPTTTTTSTKQVHLQSSQRPSGKRKRSISDTNHAPPRRLPTATPSEDADDAQIDSDPDTDTDTEIEKDKDFLVDIHYDAPGPGLGGQSFPGSNSNHTTDTLMQAMETAKTQLEAELAELETKLDSCRRACEERVGALSDLRYGRFRSSNVNNVDAMDDDDGHHHGTVTTGQGAAAATLEIKVVDALAEFTARLQS